MFDIGLDRAVLFRLATNEAFKRLVRRAPGGEARAWRAASRYVAGTSEESARSLSLELADRGIGASLDFFGERAGDPSLARSTADRYVALARKLGELPAGVWLSMDLSHIGLDIDVAFCRAQLERIVEALPDGRLVQVGAEDAVRIDRILETILPLAHEGARLGATLQANLRRSDEDADRLAQAGLHVRLVKGAYLERRDVARPYGEETDLAYVRLAHRLADSGARIALATHDRLLREALLRGLPEAECELLLGVRNEDAKQLAQHGRTVRLYVPFGEGWFRYWMRRFAESRGA
jgi:proline dehydrogenase